MIRHLQKRKRKAHYVSFSALDEIKLSLSPKNISPYGFFFGGFLMPMVEEVARKVAKTHAEFSLEMKAIDSVRFYHPIKVEDNLVCFASLNKSWRFSLEVGIKVIAEDFRLLERKKILSCYYTFAMEEKERKEKRIPISIPQTKEQKKRYFAAEKRKLFRSRSFSR